jgi:CHAT domain-containing protein/tetratricopeptide (TPR) repeat protein
MARQVEARVVRGAILSASCILALFSAHPTPLTAQATPWYQADGFRATNGNPEYSTPSKEVSLPQLNVNMAGSVRPGANVSSNPQMNRQGIQPNGFPSPANSTANRPISITTIQNPASSPFSRPNYQLRIQTSAPVTQKTLSSTTSQRSVQGQDGFDSSARMTGPTQSLRPPPSDLKKAIEDGGRTLALHESAGDKVGQAVDHAELARLFVQEDKPELAFAHIDAAEQTANTISDPRLQADIFNIKAAAKLASGRFDEARTAYQAAMVILRSLNDERGEAEVYTSEGWVLQSLGDLPHALSSYEAALYLFTKLGDEDGEVRIRLGIGSLYQSMGEVNKGFDQYRIALPKASKSQQARILVNAGEYLESQSDVGKALDIYSQSFSLLESEPDPALEATVLTGIGRCNTALGFYAEALRSLEQARLKMKEAGSETGRAAVIASIGELDYWIAIDPLTWDRDARFKDSLKEYNEALPLMRAVADRTGEIGVLTNIGLVYDAWGKSNRALPHYMAALQKMDELQTSARLEEFRIDLADQSAGLYQRVILLQAHLHHMEEAFNLSERARARAFLDQLGNNRVDLANHLPHDFAAGEETLRRENISLQSQIGQELARPGPEIDQEKISSLRLQLSVVRERYEDLLDSLKISSPEYASLLSVSPLTLPEAQRHLSPDTTVLSYFTTPDLTLAFVLTRGSFHVSKLSVTEGALSASVATLLDFSSDTDALPNLKPLYQLLIAPIKSQLKTSTLAIVPHGVLNDLPFVALTPDGKHYLGDDYAVVSLPSVSVLPYVGARIKPIGGEILVMANDQEEGLAHLSHAYDEARAVASLFDTQPLLGDAATASALRTTAGNYDILHLIAHMDHNGQDPRFSRVMTGSGKVDDGPLELHQVLDLDLRKTSLVVLSGCQGQMGTRSRGDDVIAMSRAFMYAGSPSVIASLWSVDDEATEQLMVAFYTHLKEGLSKAEALRHAQMDVRQKYPHPYYWAGFVLTGDPGQTGSSNLVASWAK